MPILCSHSYKERNKNPFLDMGIALSWGILIYCDSSVVILSFSFSFFHSSFIQCYPLGSSYLVGKVLSIGM